MAGNGLVGLYRPFFFMLLVILVMTGTFNYR